MSWVDAFVFTEPMIDMRDDPAAAARFADELHRELGPDPLSGDRWTVVARALPQDDVVVMAGDRVAMVHLTWSGKTESPPWPLSDLIPDQVAFERLIENRYWRG